MGLFVVIRNVRVCFFEFLFKMADEGAFITPLQCGRLRPLWSSFFVAFQDTKNKKAIYLMDSGNGEKRDEKIQKI